MRRIITLVSFIMLLSLACENPTDNVSHKQKLISHLVGEWNKVEERTQLDTLSLGIDESSLNCGLPYLLQDSLSIGMDTQYTRLRAAVDPDCCSTVFSIHERGHLEIIDCTTFYLVTDSLLIGFCELCQDPQPSNEIDVSSGILQLPCRVESDTIFTVGDGAVDGREPYWYR